VNLLLDTHTLLWWLDNTPSLSEAARAVISQAESIVWVSAASAWEIAIKRAIGKLRVPGNLEHELARHRFLPLGITIGHALAVEDLPSYHSDPFDRMLVAQAKIEGLTIVTRDPTIPRYGVPCIRA
jgi:PIN domain nuclease of toxin-antitoxin system